MISLKSLVPEKKGGAVREHAVKPCGLPLADRVGQFNGGTSRSQMRAAPDAKDGATCIDPSEEVLPTSHVAFHR